MEIKRLLNRPIIYPGIDPSISENIQGPSLIRVPDWIDKPLGRYYLYFADHKGTYIRLAHSNSLTGPWRVYWPGSLQLADSQFPTEPPQPNENETSFAELRARATGPDRLPHDPLFELTTPHIASPDVHVNDTNRTVAMYYHGLESFGRQVSRVAISEDGIRFKARPEILGRNYMRVFSYGDHTYALAMPGQLYRSKDGLSGFEEGPRLFTKDMRHCAVLVRRDELVVFWTQVGHAPERILLSRINLDRPWTEWEESEYEDVLKPEYDWEGAKEPLQPSVRSVAYGRLNQLRDPAIFQENGRIFLLYAVAGESGIAIAEVIL